MNRRICICCSAGGHFSEARAVSTMLTGEGEQIILVEYDASEQTRCGKEYTYKSSEGAYKQGTPFETYHMVYGHRKEWKYPITFLRNTWRSWRYLRYLRPDIVISTGAHSTVMTLVFAKLLGIRTLYIESFARVKSQSLTGKLVYPFVDVYYVQHPLLTQKKKKKIRYVGEVY